VAPLCRVRGDDVKRRGNVQPDSGDKSRALIFGMEFYSMVGVATTERFLKDCAMVMQALTSGPMTNGEISVSTGLSPKRIGTLTVSLADRGQIRSLRCVLDKKRILVNLWSLPEAKGEDAHRDSETDLRAIRREYSNVALRSVHLSENPVSQFECWFNDAIRAECRDVTAAALATTSAEGQPSVRYVLIKHFSDGGYSWYTDSNSQKGVELAINPQAALCFYWPETERQVRISGKVERVEEDLSERYFKERPIACRISALASEQSQPIACRAELENRVLALSARFQDGNVPRKKSWGGYRLVPNYFEFWQGRQDRLHDRFMYRKNGEVWTSQRLMP